MTMMMGGELAGATTMMTGGGAGGGNGTTTTICNGSLMQTTTSMQVDDGNDDSDVNGWGNDGIWDAYRGDAMDYLTRVVKEASTSPMGREEGENEKQPQQTTEADATNLYLAILEDQEKADSLANCLPVDFRKLQDIYDSASEDKLHKITRFYLLNGLDRWICTSCKIEASSLSARCQGCKSYIPFVPLEIAEFENFVICKRRDMPHWGKESVRRVISNISQAQLQSLSDQGLHEEEEEEEGEEEGEGDKTGAGATGAKLV